MKTKLLLAAVITIMSMSTQAYEEDFFSAVFQTGWCKDVGRTLQTAIFNSPSTETYEEEEQLLTQAVEISARNTPEKNNEHFLMTLKEIPVGLINYESSKSKVYYLRAQVRYALADLRYIDRRFSCPLCEGNNAEYVESVLQRGILEGASTATDKQEEFALNHAARVSLVALNDSSFTRSYSCAKVVLKNSLEIRSLEVKRGLLREAISYLDGRFFCRN